MTILFNKAATLGEVLWHFNIEQLPAAIAWANGTICNGIGKFHAPITKTIPYGSGFKKEDAGAQIILVSHFLG